MFKLKFVAKRSHKSRPYIVRETFVETQNKSVDEYVREEIKKALFLHGFTDVRVTIQRLDDLKVLSTQETIRVSLNGGRR